MKIPVLPFLLLASVALGAPVQKIGYTRATDDALVVADLDGTHAHKVATGMWPAISPDGTRLAFNTDVSTGHPGPRHIAVAKIATGKISVFKDMPSDNCFGPVWSPDGSKLVFEILLDGVWDIGLVDASGAGFRVVKKTPAKGSGFYSLAWMPDSQSLYCQDMTTIFHFGLDGSVLGQWPIATLFPHGDFDSNSKFAISPDGRTLLAEVDGDGTDTSGAPYGWEGPPVAIWSVDLATLKTSQVAPNFWNSPAWLKPGEFLCAKTTGKAQGIYIRSLDSKTVRKILLNNLYNVTVSR